VLRPFAERAARFPRRVRPLAPPALLLGGGPCVTMPLRFVRTGEGAGAGLFWNGFPRMAGHRLLRAKPRGAAQPPGKARKPIVREVKPLCSEHRAPARPCGLVSAASSARPESRYWVSVAHYRLE